MSQVNIENRVMKRTFTRSERQLDRLQLSAVVPLIPLLKLLTT